MKQWTVAPLDKEGARAIQTRYGLPAIVAMLLQIRNISSAEEIEDFLFNDSEILPPDDIKDMDKAAARVKKSIDSGELICVYGDYDADGVTSTALLYSYLEASGANAMYYIPSRETEGYGMNMGAVDYLAERGVGLIVTVDNGIAAAAEIAHASSLGIDTVVTDHHMPLRELPNACAVVDLHRSDCQSKFKQLSGVGVAFKLIMALEGEYCDTDSLLDNYSDLLSLGTIGDIVELKSDNRVFVKRGLAQMMNGDRPGIEALIQSSGLKDKALTSGNVSFTLVPRINAVGRLGSSGKSVELLLTEDDEDAAEISAAMGGDNSERRQIEKDIIDEIDAIVRKNPSLVMTRVIVIDGENWHQGVIGIVASRIREIYGKPVIIVSRDGDEAKASGRSVEGFPLCDAVADCADLLKHYGGHPMAVGLSLNSADIDAFRKKINLYAEHFGDMPFDRVKIDCKLNPAFVNVELVQSLSLMQPYGAGNPTPVFGFYVMRIEDIIPLSNNKHLKLVLSKNGVRLNVMKFFTSTLDFPYKKGDTVDIAATLELNEYNGNVSVTVICKEIKATSDNTDELLRGLRLFEDFCAGCALSVSELRELYPDRNDFALLYRFLMSKQGYEMPVETLPYQLGYKLGYGKIRVILEAMSELGLIAISEGLRESSIKLNRVASKVNIGEASIISGLKEAIEWADSQA